VKEKRGCDVGADFLRALSRGTIFQAGKAVWRQN